MVRKSTYVLVHGGGHGGWCYQRVAAILRAAGHQVYTPTMTGVGERTHLLTADTGLETHIIDIDNVLRYEDLRHVILAGHSYGGAVITGVADRALDRVEQLVFLDAALPMNGESIADASPGIRAVALADTRTVNGIELILWPDNPISRAIYGITDDGDWAWARERLSPHPWRTFLEPLRLQNVDAVARLPRTLINCTSTMRTWTGESRIRHLAGDRVWQIDTGHDLMITEPEKTAALLLQLV